MAEKRLEIKDYVHFRELIELARTDEQLEDAIKKYKAKAKGDDLKDLNEFAAYKKQRLDFISSGGNRAIRANITYN